MSLPAGTRVGRYTLQRLLAQGGMAEVYRAEQALTSGISRQVAVKVIRPEYSESPDFRGMFLDEARTACTLSHPNIVHIYEVGETDEGQLYMAMELVSGETLATINRTLRDHGERLSDEALFAVGIWTAGALEAVHALKVEGGHANLVHRDVSPHNLLLSSTGALKLIDFGIAKAATNRNLTVPGVTKGKAGYFSPEQAMGKALDGRSDLFSLGVTLYKLAAGETPFDGHRTHSERHAALVRGHWKPLEAVCPGLPAGLYEVVDTALRLKPEARFQTARELRETLEKAAFDAGLRVSQSTLLGYVDDEGDITAVGGARSAVAPLTNPPTQTQRSPGGRALEPTTPRGAPLPPATRPARPALFTEPHVPAPRKRPSAALLAAVTVGAVVLGVTATALLLEPEPEVLPELVQLDEPPPAPAAEPTAPDVEVTPASDPEVLAPAAAPAPEAEVPPATPPATPPPATAKVPAPRPPPPPRADKPPPVEAAIPTGEGKLRINATAPSARIVVGAEDWGEPPVNRKVSSGWYRVTVQLPDGSSASSRAGVWPDQTTTLVFDAATQRWTSSAR